jgi:hypothetical protein
MMTMTGLNNIHVKDEYIEMEMGVSSISEDSPDPTKNGSVPAVDATIDFLPHIWQTNHPKS